MFKRPLMRQSRQINLPYSTEFKMVKEMALSIIQTIPWHELECAYGSAKDAPEHLEHLYSGNEEEIEDAVYDFLHSSACHQYSTYSCTPYVVRCVINLLNTNGFESHLLHEIIGFIQACTHNASDLKELRNEIITGKECYIKYLKHTDIRVIEIAKDLVQFCSKYEC